MKVLTRITFGRPFCLRVGPKPIVSVFIAPVAKNFRDVFRLALYIRLSPGSHLG
jgi:hypothetical protein